MLITIKKKELAILWRELIFIVAILVVKVTLT